MSWLKKAAGSVSNFLKKSKILSTLGGALGPMAGAYAPAIGAATGAASSLGYGRRSRAARMRGRGPRLNSLFSGLKKANSFLRDSGALSAGLGMLSNSGLLKNTGSARAGTASNLASALGYGRRGKGLRLAGGALRLAGNRRM
jgi:hypothetical protein